MVAINDIVYLLIKTLFLETVLAIFAVSPWLYYCIFIILWTNEILEPLLVFSFSVERLIAISRPLQVRCMRL